MIRNITFFLPSLEGGGAERNIVYLLEGLDRTQYHATLVLAKKKGVFLKYVPKDIRIWAVNLFSED
jgi:hypothetical protein